MIFDELCEQWNRIPHDREGFLLATENHTLSFHIGYDNGGKKCFIVMNSGKIDGIESSKAIKAECIEFSNGSFGLQFSLLDPNLEELFLRVCWDLIECSRGSEDEAIKVVIRRYISWQNLLQKTRKDSLDKNVQKGLVGELLFLSEKIDEYGEHTAIEAWVGPDGNDQDFIFNEFWAEIKAVKVSAEKVSISSLQQLDREDNGFLCVYFLDEINDEECIGISLAQLIAAIKRKLISEYNIDIFNCKLIKYGLMQCDLGKYNKPRYRLAENRKYAVNSKFPRLIRKNISPDIVTAKYELSLSAIDKFRI